MMVLAVLPDGPLRGEAVTSCQYWASRSYAPVTNAVPWSCNVALIGDLPACDGAGEGGFAAGGAAGGVGHVGEGGEDFGGLGPDGDILHGVVVGDLRLGEAVGWRGRREAVDGGDVAVAVAEAGRDAGSGVGGGVAADVEFALGGDFEELRVDQRVHLLGHHGVSGFVGEDRRRGEEAVGMVGEMGVEAGDEVLGGGFGFGVAGGEREQQERGE